MPSRDPLLASLSMLAMESSGEEVNRFIPVVPSSPAIDIPRHHPVGQRLSHSVDEINTSSCNLEFLPPSVPLSEKHIKSQAANIPEFSYSYQSPVSSPPIARVHSEYLSIPDIGVPQLPHTSSSQNTLRRRPSFSSETQSVSGYTAVLTSGLLHAQRSSSDEGKLARKKAGWTESFLESGGLVLPPAMGHFPRPHEGQTLTSFLTSLSDNLPDLDRENAHFNVSEALISAFERIKIKTFQEKLRAERNLSTCSRCSDEDCFGTVRTSTPPVYDLEGLNSTHSPKRHKNTKRDVVVKNVLTETEESEYVSTSVKSYFLIYSWKTVDQ